MKAMKTESAQLNRQK